MRVTDRAVLASPNIWNWPDIYERENEAIDADGAVWAALAEQVDWCGADVVDVGCGDGFHLPRFAQQARSVVGVEPHPPWCFALGAGCATCRQSRYAPAARNGCRYPIPALISCTRVSHIFSVPAASRVWSRRIACFVQAEVWSSSIWTVPSLPTVSGCVRRHPTTGRPRSRHSLPHRALTAAGWKPYGGSVIEVSWRTCCASSSHPKWQRGRSRRRRA